MEGINMLKFNLYVFCCMNGFEVDFIFVFIDVVKF